MQGFLDNARHWRARAEETRAIGETMTNEKTRDTLDAIARDYEALACMADEREEMRKRIEAERKR
jgi:hypothetical protein